VAKLAGVDQDCQTQTGVILGTPSYMAPEQASGKNKEVGPAVDIYALGAILYETLTGRPPFRGATPLDTLEQVRTQEPVPPSRLQPRTPRDLETICLKCLHKEPSGRYVSAEALAEDCAAFLAGKPIRARRAGALYQLGKFARRNKALVSAAVFLFLALTVGSWLGAMAVIQRGRADLAEKEKSLLEADGYVQAARLAAQRGRWREALVDYEKALQTGHGETVALRLNKIRALLALNEFGRARSEVDALLGSPDLGGHEGSVLLLQGDILLSHGEARGERFLRQALEKELAPGEQAYAESLLAETTPEAVTHLRQSLAQDPYQPRARAVLGLLLILLARLPEARIALTEHETLFPEDVNAKVLLAGLLALEDGRQPPAVRRAAAIKVLEGMRGQLQEGDVVALQGLIHLLSQLQDPDNPIDDVTGFPNLTPYLAALAPVFPHLARVPAEAGPGDVVAAYYSVSQNFPMPVLVRKLGDRFLHAVLEANKGFPKAALDEMDEVARMHPEGTILYTRAMILFSALRFAEAEQAAREAADAPALLPVRRPALLVAASSEAMLYTVTKEEDWLRQAAGNFRKILEFGPLRAAHHRLIAINCAIAAREFNLARQILDDWEKQEPADLGALRFRALTETKAGAYGTALQAAEAFLKKKPDDAEMLQLKKDAVEKLRAQVLPYAQPGGGGP
jgi:tetratricopeptide (TPR) repeat protein